MSLPDHSALMRALMATTGKLAREHLSAFVRPAWTLLNPGAGLIWNWHIDAKCEHLEAVTRGEITRLVINEPPGHTKTTIVSHGWPAWEWLHHPEHRWCFAGYVQDLTNRDNRKRRMLIESDWYRQAFQPRWRVKPGQRNVTTFANDREGEMNATSVGGRATGYHYDRIVIDDPLEAEDVYTTRLAGHVEWFEGSIESRVRHPEMSAFVLIMQRLHKLELAGVLLKRGGWEHLCLPERYVPGKYPSTSIGWSDPRTEEGELLNPGRFDKEKVEEIWKNLGSRKAAAQRQQDPVVAEGNVFLRHWWRYWDNRADGERADGTRELPDDVDAMVTYWDCTFKQSSSSDYVVGLAWARKGADFFLLDEVRARMTFTQTKRAVGDFSRKWDMCPKTIVELAANGFAIVDALKSEVPGLIGEQVGKLGSKEARAEAVTPLIEAGNVYIPHPDIAPWVNDYVEEMSAFPLGEYDDRVDATSGGLRDLNSRLSRFTLPPPSAVAHEESAERRLARLEREATRFSQRNPGAEIKSARLPPVTSLNPLKAG